MSALSLQDLDEIRKQGLRPTIVGCFTNKKKLLLLYHDEYKLWQFPQGGVVDGQEVEKALKTELREEIGEDLLMYANSKPVYIGRDQVFFKPGKFGNRKLKLMDGKSVPMRGKAYLFYVIDIPVEHLDMEPAEYDHYKWVTLDEAKEIVETIYQPGKQRITQKALELLEEQKFVK